MEVGDRILGKPRGTAAEAIANVDRPEQIDRDYLTEVYRVAPAWGVDPAIVASQWHIETGGGTSPRWTRNGNPAGLLVSQPGDPDPAVWTGTEAAHVHVWALAHACDPTIGPDWGFLPSSAAYFVSRWTMKYHDSNCPAVTTIDDLNIRYTDATGEPQATWAWDAEYQDLIVQRSKVLFGDLPDQGTPTGTTTLPPSLPFPFSTRIPGLPGGPLGTTYPIFINLIPASQTRQRPGINATSPRRSVQHGTGNAANSSALAEAQYFVNGAEGRQASIHYCTDDLRAGVVVPLDEVTWQAADGAGPGNLNGFSCEMMESTAIWSNSARRDALIALTADLMGRTAARLGATKPERHWDFNFNNPPSSRHHCPDKLMSTGLWESAYVPLWHAARQDELRRMAGIPAATTTTRPPTPSTTTTTPPFRYPPRMDRGRAERAYGTATDATGKVYRFAEADPVCRLWLSEGDKADRFPRLERVALLPDTEKETGRRDMYFVGGLLIYVSDNRPPVVRG